MIINNDILVAEEAAKYTFSITSDEETDILPYQKGRKAYLALLEIAEMLRSKQKHSTYQHEETENVVEMIIDNFYQALERNDVSMDDIS